MAGLKIRDVASSRLEELDRDRLERSLESERTIVAREEEEADAVADRFDAADGELVVVVDAEGRATAVVDPEQVHSEAERRRGAEPRGSRPTLRESLKDLDLDSPAEDSPLDAERRFETMISARPRLHWCAIGQHYVSRPPCRDHEI
jgi:hypothetical protein